MSVTGYRLSTMSLVIQQQLLAYIHPCVQPRRYFKLRYDDNEVTSYCKQTHIRNSCLLYGEYNLTPNEDANPMVYNLSIVSL